MRVRTLSMSRWLEELYRRENAMELTMCRFEMRDNDWVLPGKALDEHLMILVERGAIDVRFEGEGLRLVPGMLLWIPQNTWRELRGVDLPRDLWQYKLRFRLKDPKGTHLAFSRSRLLAENALEVVPTLQGLIDEYKRPSRFHQHRVRGMLATLATDVLAMAGARGVSARALNGAQRRRLDEYVAQNIARGITPADLAARIKLSLDYFSRLFRRTYGVAPKTYLKRERMRVAAHLLAETDASVKQVASELGFENASFFCRQFRSVYRQSPGTYRAQGGG